MDECFGGFGLTMVDTHQSEYPSQQVPSRLRGKQLYSLDLGQLVVGEPQILFFSFDKNEVTKETPRSWLMFLLDSNVFFEVRKHPSWIILILRVFLDSNLTPGSILWADGCRPRRAPSIEESSKIAT